MRVRTRARGFGRTEDLDANLGYAGADEVDRPGRRVGKVDDPSIDKWPAVDDANFNSFVVGEVDDANPGVEW
jgi:hypothetical protein